MFCLVGTKECSRCGGDLFLECDLYGTYITCIQCGATLNAFELHYDNNRSPNERQPKKAEKAVSTCA